jgi:hypothetical protein
MQKICKAKNGIHGEINYSQTTAKAQQNTTIYKLHELWHSDLNWSLLILNRIYGNLYVKINEAQFARIFGQFPIQRGNVVTDSRDFINAIFYIAEKGCKWRALPPEFWKWQTICNLGIGQGEAQAAQCGRTSFAQIERIPKGMCAL